MGDLISRSALMAKLEGKAKANEMLGYMTAYDVTKECIEVVSEQPTVDAVPVVHGEWIKGDLGEWKCSVCREENCYAYDENLKKFTDLYCPNCGADMRKKVQE